MMLRRVPRTDSELSAISFGAGTAAGLMVGGDRTEQIEALAAARDGGVNHVDTAPIYGWGASEVNIGAALKRLKSDMLVTSKINVTAEFLATGNIETCIARSVRASLTRLRRDHLDFVLLHNPLHRGRDYRDPDDPRRRQIEMCPPVTLDDYIGHDGVWETLSRLRDEGLVRHIGLGGAHNDTATLRAAFASGMVAIYQQPYNLLNPTATRHDDAQCSGTHSRELSPPDAPDFDNSMAVASGLEVGVSVISPIAAGVLSDDAVDGRPAPAVSDRSRRFAQAGQFNDLVERARPFRELASSHGLSLAELAYRFCLSATDATTVVGGFSTTSHVVAAARYAEHGPLEPHLIDDIKRTWESRTHQRAHHEG